MSDKLWVREETDEDGTSVIVVLDEHLENFPILLRAVINRQIGLERGYFKIRLDTSVQKSENKAAMMDFIKSYYSKKDAKTKHIPKPDSQSFHYGSTHEHVYGFRVNVSLSKSNGCHIKKFKCAAANVNTYDNQTNCCLLALNNGVKELSEHYWSTVRQQAIKSPNLVQSVSQDAIKPVGVLNEATLYGNESTSTSPILYGCGIPLEKVSFPITRRLNLSRLGTVLHLISEKIPGLSYPFLYVGTLHASFPFHIEDAALFSINYVHLGAPCVWFIVPPAYYKMFLDMSHHFRLDLGQVSCNNILGHKYVMSSAEFLQGLGINVNTVVQKANELLITYPYTPHSGFKCGWNVQQAANFGDAWWVEPAILAPTCACFIHQVKLNLSEIIAREQPHLLNLYKSNDVTKLMKKLSQNEFIKKLGLLPLSFCKKVSAPTASTSAASSPNSVGRCILKCPDDHCANTWAGGRSKLKRVLGHIKKVHNNSPTLLNKLYAEYPPKETERSQQCHICSKWFSGNEHHLRRHLRIVHST